MNFKGLTYDATNSWSGYIYQGKVALYVAIENIIKLYNDGMENNISNYYLELEWLEDFSIVEKSKEFLKYKTIHQVKTESSSNLLDFKDAFYKLSLKLIEYPEIQNAYLHTRLPLSVLRPNIVTEIKKIIQNGSYNEENINKITEILSKKDFREVTKKRNGRKPEHIKMILDKLNDITDSMSIETAINEIVTENKLLNDEINNKLTDDLFDKFSIYEYNGNSYCDLDNIETLTKELIKNYLTFRGIFALAADSNYIETIYHCLLHLVDKHVAKRHKNYSMKTRTTEDISIPFIEFDSILSNSSLMDRPEIYYLSKMKDRFFKHKETYCLPCEDDCENCEIVNLDCYIRNLAFEDFKYFSRVINPDINSKITEKTEDEFFSKDGIMHILEFIENAGIESDVGNIYLKYTTSEKEDVVLTEIRSTELKKCNENICCNIIKNNNIVEVFRDIHGLITKDIDVPSIYNCASSIMDISKENDGTDYSNHILHSNNVALYSKGNIKLDTEA